MSFNLDGEEIKKMNYKDKLTSLSVIKRDENFSKKKIDC